MYVCVFVCIICIYGWVSAYARIKSNLRVESYSCVLGLYENLSLYFTPKWIKCRNVLLADATLRVGGINTKFEYTHTFLPEHELYLRLLNFTDFNCW